MLDSVTDDNLAVTTHVLHELSELNLQDALEEVGRDIEKELNDRRSTALNWEERSKAQSDRIDAAIGRVATAATSLDALEPKPSSATERDIEMAKDRLLHADATLKGLACWAGFPQLEGLRVRAAVAENADKAVSYREQAIREGLAAGAGVRIVLLAGLGSVPIVGWLATGTSVLFGLRAIAQSTESNKRSAAAYCLLLDGIAWLRLLRTSERSDLDTRHAEIRADFDKRDDELASIERDLDTLEETIHGLDA